MPSALDQLKRQAYAYPGGLESLAPRIGLTVEVLRKKLGGQTHELKLSEVELILAACCEVNSPHKHAFATTIALSCGVLVGLPMRELAPPGCVHKSMATVVKESADIALTTAESDSDKHFSDNDRDRSLRDCDEAIEALMQHKRNVIERHARDNADRTAAPR